MKIAATLILTVLAANSLKSSFGGLLDDIKKSVDSVTGTVKKVIEGVIPENSPSGSQGPGNSPSGTHNPHRNPPSGSQGPGYSPSGTHIAHRNPPHQVEGKSSCDSQKDEHGSSSSEAVDDWLGGFNVNVNPSKEFQSSGSNLDKWNDKELEHECRKFFNCHSIQLCPNHNHTYFDSCFIKELLKYNVRLPKNINTQPCHHFKKIIKSKEMEIFCNYLMTHDQGSPITTPPTVTRPPVTPGEPNGAPKGDWQTCPNQYYESELRKMCNCTDHQQICDNEKLTYIDPIFGIFLHRYCTNALTVIGNCTSLSGLAQNSYPLENLMRGFYRKYLTANEPPQHITTKGPTSNSNHTWHNSDPSHNPIKDPKQHHHHHQGNTEDTTTNPSHGGAKPPGANHSSEQNNFLVRLRLFVKQIKDNFERGIKEYQCPHDHIFLDENWRKYFESLGVFWVSSLVNTCCETITLIESCKEFKQQFVAFCNEHQTGNTTESTQSSGEPGGSRTDTNQTDNTTESTQSSGEPGGSRTDSNQTGNTSSIQYSSESGGSSSDSSSKTENGSDRCGDGDCDPVMSGSKSAPKSQENCE